MKQFKTYGLSPSDVIHEDTPILPVPTSWEELSWLGYTNLKQLFLPYRRREETLREEIAMNYGDNASPYAPELIELAEVRKRIEILRFLMKGTKDKPLFPSLRSSKNFWDKHLPKALCFLGGDLLGNVHRVCAPYWAVGEMESEVHSKRGVFYQLKFSEPIVDGLYSDTVSYDLYDPRMIDWRHFQQLRQDQKFLQVWAMNTVPSLSVPPLMWAYLVNDFPIIGMDKLPVAK